MKQSHNKNLSVIFEKMFMVGVVAVVAFFPALGFADDFATASGGACKFVKNVHTVLNLLSVTVVTIAIIFAGYQIAFAHKRISDVAPVLLGGFLIGAAGQIAKMLVNGSESCSAATTGALYIIQFFA